MQLARAFTKRLGRPSSAETAQEPTGKPVRPTISMPMGLISTTNQSVHNHPTISASQTKAVQQRQISSSSGSSVNGSETSSSTTPDTPGMTDTSSVESYSPIEPNHLSQYFTSVSKPAAKPSILSPVPEPTEPAIHLTPPSASTTWRNDTLLALSSAPVLPKRSPSHSVREHERLARVRSTRSSSRGPSKSASVHEPITQDESTPTLAPIAPLRSPSRPASTAVCTSTPRPEAEDKFVGPFSQELIQLQEVAEEFAPSASPDYSTRRSSWERESAEAEEDMRIMREKGLRCHRASEYLRDIAALREALWDLAEDEPEEEVLDQTPPAVDDDDDHEEFHDAVSAWI